MVRFKLRLHLQKASSVTVLYLTVAMAEFGVFLWLLLLYVWFFCFLFVLFFPNSTYHGSRIFNVRDSDVTKSLEFYLGENQGEIFHVESATLLAE